MHLIDYIRRVDNAVMQAFVEKGWQLPVSQRYWEDRKKFGKYKEENYFEYCLKFQLTKEDVAALKEFKIGIKRMIGDLQHSFGGRLIYSAKGKEESKIATLKALNGIENMLITCHGYAIALRMNHFLEDVLELKERIERIKKEVELEENIENYYMWFFVDYANLGFRLERLIRRRPTESNI